MSDPRFFAKSYAERLRNLFLMSLRREAKPGVMVAASEREAALIEALSTVLADIRASIPKPSVDE